MTDADRLLVDALRLPEEERVKLIARLAESLEAPNPRAGMTDEELVTEIERRADDAAGGRTTGSPWDEVRARVFGENKP